MQNYCLVNAIEITNTVNGINIIKRTGTNNEAKYSKKGTLKRTKINTI